ncbi:MAG: T9SS type A sorting domain-containing protein [Saprospiraceae bacterium]|nr:T9SS type A sorting domain-containing protein [Saprospiraceae bacterium]
MKRCYLFFYLFWIVPGSIVAQQSLLKPNALVISAREKSQQIKTDIFRISTERSGLKVPSDIKSYSLLSIDKEAVRNLSSSKSSFISLSIPQSGRNEITLDLVEVNPLAEDFILRAAPSMKIMPVIHGKHYRGVVHGDDKSVAAISIFDDEIMGMISSPSAEGNLVIGKLENSDQHIIYQDDQTADKRKAACSTVDDMQNYTDDELRGVHTGTRALTDCVRLYLEVDYDIFVNKGNSVLGVNNYIAAVFNQVSTLYANEQLNTVVSEVVVWTQASPYNATSSDGMLTAFGNNRQGFNGDLAMLLSYKVGGGIAWVNGFCRSNPDYSMSYAGIQSSYQNVPTYSWTVEVCAHEFGHLFGSQHTHACVWNGNNTAIDGCSTPEGSCPNPGLPSAAVGGTIMSYCHLTSVGIKFSNGFGPQPGNIMRSKVTTATCLQPCSGSGGGGGTQCTDNVLTMELRTDTYANETTWEVKNSAGTIAYSGGPYTSSNTLYNISMCLPSGCYTFTIKDTYGDGICCAYGSGSYTIKQGSTSLITGGQFGATETKSFCTSGGSSNLSLSTNSGSTGSSSGSASVGVTSNVSWTAVSNATSWCTVSPGSGSNNGTLAVSYLTNSSTSSRSATITVSGGGLSASYVLTQSGSTPSPTLSLSTNSGSAGSSSGSASVGVTSNVSWTAVSNATSWCTVSPGSGSNNGTLTITYQANSSTSARSAIIVVSGGGLSASYVLTQSGSTPSPTLSLSTNGGSAGSSSGSASVGVTSNVSWAAVSNATSWCTVSPGSGSNNGTLTVIYQTNSSTSARSATMTVSGGGLSASYILTQSGSTPSPTLSLSTNGGSAGSSSGSASVGVNSNVSWTAVSNATSWCTISPGSGSNNGNLAVTYQTNNSTSARSAIIVVSGGGLSASYILTQSGSTPSPTLALSTNSGSAGSSSGSASVGVTSNVSWTAASNSTSWCTVSPGSGSNNGTLTVTYQTNSSTSARSATITVSGGGLSTNYILTQSGTQVATCFDNIKNGDETGVDCGGSCAPCGSCITIVVEIKTDQYPTEISWNIKNALGVIVGNGGSYTAPYAVNNSTFCLPSGCYTFNINDTYGDGIISPGYFKVSQGTNVVVSNVPYSTSKTINFCLSTSSGPTCNDGIQNGNETGIDCGGSCTPCPTCSDGIKNGNETGIDCGGSCVPCSTCNDGIKNGNETGIDCGGSCTPCPTCSDGIKNGNETGIDCGGSCVPCSTCNDGIKNGNEAGIDCGGSCTPCPTCSDGIKNGDETGVDCGGSCAPCGSCINIVVEIKTDQYPTEISWNIKNSAGTIVANGGNYTLSYSTNTHAYCLPSGCYTFNITDAYGDGILSPGYFKVMQGSTTVVNNTIYTTSKTINFCLGPGVEPTCSDGIKNGTETGVDCGGSCSPCPTCSDGIKNGNETGIDCGGSCAPCSTCNDGIKNGNEIGIDCGGSCTPCPTCSDGIKNGNETGIDCGGSCPPCTSGSGITVLSGTYFEVDWEGWIDGGSDCFRYFGSYSPEGNYSIRIRDNSDIESSMTSPVYNLTPYNTVMVEFKFRAVDMDPGEDFWLRYYNGTTWSTVAAFISGSSFQNDQLYTVTITLTGSFPSNAQFRFQCDASENDDQVYIDAVIISASSGSNLVNEVISIKSENNIVHNVQADSGISIIPNPSEDFIKIILDDHISKIHVYNLAGQLMALPKISDNNILDISNLNTGVYIISVETEDQVFTRRIIKI